MTVPVEDQWERKFNSKLQQTKIAISHAGRVGNGIDQHKDNIEMKPSLFEKAAPAIPFGGDYAGKHVTFIDDTEFNSAASGAIIGMLISIITDYIIMT